MTKKVMILMGGFSSEREVSLISGKGIIKALNKKGYEVIEHDLTDTRKLLKAIEKEIIYTLRKMTLKEIANLPDTAIVSSYHLYNDTFVYD